jgi:thiol-disulfide isomerase/thioredoxin
MVFIKHLKGLCILLFLFAACAPAASVTSNTPTATLSPSTPPIWVTTELIDANSGKHFTINDYKGKVVLVDGMATWCPTCFKEAQQLKILHDIYGSQSGFVTISLGLDFKEDADILKGYAKDFGFDWPYATATLEITRDFGNSYGALFIDPTLVPMFIVDRKGHVYTLPFGYKTAEALKQVLDPFIKADL